MTENKTLTRFTNGMLIADVLIMIWDTGLATYNFIQGRWISGLFLVAVVAFLLWAVKGLLESRMRHEHMMKVLEEMRSRTEVGKDIVESADSREENSNETDAH